MSHAYYAVAGTGVTGLWECSEDGTVVYGLTGQVKHDTHHDTLGQLVDSVRLLGEAVAKLAGVGAGSQEGLTAEGPAGGG